MTYIGVSPSNGVRRVHTYTATGSQTTFTGASSEGITLSYTDANFMDVYQNGVLLAPADYTATSGTSVVLAEGAAASDIVTITVYDAFSVADTVSKSAGGTFDGNVAMAGTLNVAGETTLQTHLNLGDNDKIKLGASGDLEIYHSGSESYISDTGTGYLFMQGAAQIRLQNPSGSNYAIFTDGGASTLYHNNSAKIATSSTGVTVTGNIANASGDFTLDVAGDIILDAGGAEVKFADDGTQYGTISNSSTNLVIKSDVSDKDIIFQGNDGGSVITALTLDMSDGGRAAFAHNADFVDGRGTRFGAGNDLQIYHDGSNSYINDTGTGSLIIEGANVQIQDTQQDLLAKFNNAGAVQLYHVDSGTSNVKLATSGTGVTVTGTAKIEKNGQAINLDTPSSSQNVWINLSDNGSAKWEIQKNTANLLNIYSYDAGSNVMTFDGSGRVGIGTTSPGQLLEINGASNPAVLIKDTTNNCITYMYSQDSVATMGSASNHPVVFNVHNGEKMRIHTGGQVSIATTDATHGLNVGQSGTDYRGRFQGNNQYRLGLQSGTASVVWLGSGGADNFRVSNSSGSTRFEVEANGYMKVSQQARIMFQGNSNGNTNIASGEIFGSTNDGNPAFNTGASFCQAVGITYNSATGRFTVPTAGRYLIHFQAYYNAGAASCRIATYINTVQVNLAHDSSIIGTMHLNFVANMSANDYIDFRQISGGTQAWYMGIAHMAGHIILLN